MSRNPTNSFLSVLCRLRQKMFTDFYHVYLLFPKLAAKLLRFLQNPADLCIFLLHIDILLFLPQKTIVYVTKEYKVTLNLSAKCFQNVIFSKGHTSDCCLLTIYLYSLLNSLITFLHPKPTCSQSGCGTSLAGPTGLWAKCQSAWASSFSNLSILFHCYHSFLCFNLCVYVFSTGSCSSPWCPTSKSESAFPRHSQRGTSCRVHSLTVL